MECFEIEKKRREIIEFLEKICYPRDIKCEVNIYNSLTPCQNADIILRYHGRQEVIRFDIYRDSIYYIKTCIIDAMEHIWDGRSAMDVMKHYLNKVEREGIKYFPYTYSKDREHMPKPKKIILNDPATIIFWSDGTKTVVKKNSKDRKFDPEKGIALCYMKKALGNKGNYNNVFRDWIK
jgi:hypothetical protein